MPTLRCSDHCDIACPLPCPGAQCLFQLWHGLLLGNDPHRRCWHSLSLPGTPPSTAIATPFAIAPAAALAPRPHPRPHDHLFQRRRRHHPLRQRADRWRDVRLPSLGQWHVRGRRGPRALPNRRRALEPLPPRAPRRPDDLQALRRAGRLARQPGYSLYLRELRTALCGILALSGLATAQPSAKRLPAIALTSVHPARATPAPTFAGTF